MIFFGRAVETMSIRSCLNISRRSIVEKVEEMEDLHHVQTAQRMSERVNVSDVLKLRLDNGTDAKTKE